MSSPHATGPLSQIALGTLLGLSFFGASHACAGASRLPALAACKLDALSVLPADPMRATVYDAVDVIERVQACHRQSDAGP